MHMPIDELLTSMMHHRQQVRRKFLCEDNKLGENQKNLTSGRRPTSLKNSSFLEAQAISKP